MRGRVLGRGVDAKSCARFKPLTIGFTTKKPRRARSEYVGINASGWSKFD